MIKVSNLTKRYGSKIAVNNVSFHIKKGETVGFLGPNGAGKTTTMNIVTGYLSSNEGTVSIADFNILEQPLEAKKHIGYLPEHPPLYFDMTVKEYLNFVFDLKKCTLKREAHINEICEVVKIKHVYGRLIKNLSKGYKQRVGLAQALIGNPDVLILDEPTVGLDPSEIVEIRDLIRRLGGNRTVILSSHVLSEIQAICDRILIINQGSLIADASSDELAKTVSDCVRTGITLSAPLDEALEEISALPGVLSVSVDSSECGSVSLTVDSSPEVDLNRSVFSLCVEKGWTISVMAPIELTLEDIFLRLVKTKKEDE